MKTLEKSETSFAAPDDACYLCEEDDTFCLCEESELTPLQLLINTYLDSIGQDDGGWTDAGWENIPYIYPQSPLAAELEKPLTPEWQARVHKDLLDTGLAAADIIDMNRDCHFALSDGWELFPVKDSATQTTHWLICGKLFPNYDGRTEGWVVYLPADEVLRQSAAAAP